MRVRKLQLIHFRSARSLTLELHPNLNVLVGVNGAGKTTILDALAITLSWAAARLRSPNANGRRIADSDIQNDKRAAWLEIECGLNNQNGSSLTWRLTQARKGRNPEKELGGNTFHGMTSLSKLSEWAHQLRDEIGERDGRVNLPLFVYYPVHRAVLDIPLRIKKSHSFDLLDAYDTAFTMGANFREFFEWYRNREDLENERLRETRELREDPQLRAVRKAIRQFLPEFRKISVKRNPLRMEVVKTGTTLRVDQMSDGEKCLFAMVGDLARRLAIANPDRKDVLKGDGIVLIDEIDLHLHPSWQRMVVTKLQETFPNCQFVMSTHSPQVFGEVDAQCIRKLEIDEPVHGLVATTPTQALGLDSSEILEEQMGARSRNEAVARQLEQLFDLIDAEQFEEAKSLILDLRQELHGDIPQLVRAESLISMLEPAKD